MVIRHKQYFIYLFFLIAVTQVSVLTKNIIFDYQLFVHDFSQERIFSRFSYHFALMLQPTIIAWGVFMHFKGFWKTVALVTFLYFTKDCIDVVIHNNVAPTVEFDLISYLLIIIVTLLWASLKKKMLI